MPQTIAHVASSSKDGTTGGVSQSSIVINKPAGVVSGHFMVAAIDMSSANTVTAPSGWVNLPTIATDIGASGQANLFHYYKIAGASEPSSYTWSFTAGAYVGGVISAYSGVDPNAPFDATPTSQTSATNSTTITAPAITTVTDGAMIVRLLGARRVGSQTTFDITPPAGYTERAEAHHAESGSNNDGVEIEDKVLATAGTEAAASATLGGATVTPSAITIALTPAPLPTEPMVHGTTSASQTTAGTLTINKPTRNGGAAPVVGDLLIGVFAGVTITPITATGWTNGPTLVTSNYQVLYRYVDGTEGASFTFSRTGSTTGWQGAIMLVANPPFESDGPLLNGTPGATTTGSTTAVASSITGENHGVDIVFLRHRGMTGATTITAPGSRGWVEEADLNISGVQTLAVYQRQLSATGATGTDTFTASQASTAGFQSVRMLLAAVHPTTPITITAAARAIPGVTRRVNLQANASVRAIPGSVGAGRILSRTVTAIARAIPPPVERIRHIIMRSTVRAMMPASFLKSVVQRIRKLNVGAYLAGKSGTVRPRVSLYTSNLLGEEVQVVDTGETMSIDLQNGRDHTWEMRLRMAATDKLNPLTDYIKPTIDYYNGERWERWPLGLYRASVPNSELVESSSTWDIQGRSLESLLAEDMSPGSYMVPAGNGILNEVKGLIQVRLGVPLQMIDFPDDNEEVVLPAPMLFDIVQHTDQCYYLAICNSLLITGGFRQLQTMSDGRWVTRKYEDPAVYEPDARYGVETGYDPIVNAESPMRVDRNIGEFANMVIAVSNDSTTGPVVGMAANHNPESPYSIENLGKTVVKTINLQQIVDQATADLLARVELARRGGIFEKLSWETPLDPRRGPSEVADIRLADVLGSEEADGLWIYEGFAVDLEPIGMMGHDASRLTAT